MVKTITIGHLYPRQMNVYGDMGNVITLRYRLEQRRFGVKYLAVDSLAQLDHGGVDILVGGGGQDSNQELVQADLQKYSRELKARCEDGLVALMICGMYQLCGHRFVAADGSEIIGTGILDMETKAGPERLIGNITVASPFGTLVGFENHSGRTYLGSSTTQLGRVLKGAGNNGQTQDEGATLHNIFASYMHGPILAKNPQFADELIRRAIAQKGAEVILDPLDDFTEHQAARIAAKRPR